MKEESTWLDLLVVFLPLSFLTIGGGQSIVADIHRQAVANYGWITDAQFLELFTLSRLTPGPGSVLVTLVGWKADGWLGAAVASLAAFLPSSLAMYGLAQFWQRNQKATWLRVIEAGLIPIAAGMMLASGCTVLSATDGSPRTLLIVAIALLLFLFTQVNPLLILAVGAGVTMWAGG